VCMSSSTPDERVPQAPPAEQPLACSATRTPPAVKRRTTAMAVLAFALPVALGGLAALAKPPSCNGRAAATPADGPDGTAWLMCKYESLSWVVPITNAFRFRGDTYASETMHSALWNGSAFDLQFSNRLIANATFEVVRRLASASGALEATPPRHPSTALRLLDAGCGWGATTFFLDSVVDEAAALRAGIPPGWLPLSYDGVTLSTAQAQRANAIVAARHELGERCRFLVRSYEEELPADDYAVIVALESIEHASDLSTVLSHFERALLPGGALLIMTDLAHTAAHVHSDAWHLYQRHWCGPHTHVWAPPIAHDAWQLAAGGAGLRITHAQDLSSRLPRRSQPALAAYLHGLRAMHAVAELLSLPGVAAVLSNQLGGVARELLLHDESIQHTFLVLSKPL